MMSRRSAIGLLLSLALALTFGGSAAANPEIPTMNAAAREKVLTALCSELEARYVFPDVAMEMSRSVAKRAKKGAYKDVTDPEALATALTQDLQSISHDKHLRVRYSAEPMQRVTTEEPSEAERLAMVRRMARGNFGFEQVSNLDGNIGYLDLRGFASAELGGETAVAAMGMLAHSDALIIDLRKNGGGYPSMIQLLSSYLFGSEPVHLNDLYWREGDETQQFWTLPHVPGTRRPDIDVYVLTSGDTFSAAEEFSYNLQSLKRATIVGETTRGGAHPGGGVALDEHFVVWVPQGRAINPITGTNWEGVGVKPDVATTADRALDTAWVMALEKQRATASEDPPFLAEIDAALKAARARLGEAAN